MAAPVTVSGTPPKSKSKPKASTPGGKNNPDATKNNDGKKQKGVYKVATALNPPFDPRMRRIGSPLNLTGRIQRGWIQSTDGKRVNFLFNPSQLDLTHTVDPDAALNPAQKIDGDLNPDYVYTASSTGVRLLYDRTYELFSPDSSGKTNFANKYGVWADVAAWYTFVGMLRRMPTAWDDSFITAPPQYNPAWLFVGPSMAYYGWVNSINVTYSHWTQAMVPSRCAVDIGFQILPYAKKAPVPGYYKIKNSAKGAGAGVLLPNDTTGQVISDNALDWAYDYGLGDN